MSLELNVRKAVRLRGGDQRTRELHDTTKIPHMSGVVASEDVACDVGRDLWGEN